AAAPLAGLGRAAAGRGRAGEAVEHLERALALEPEATRLHYPLALAYRDAGDPEEARRHLERRGEGRPRVRDPLVEELSELAVGGGFHLVRGDRAMLNGDAAAAVEEYRKAVAASPESFAFRKALGLALYRRLDLAGAEGELRRALELEPQGPPARRASQRAEVRRHLGQLLLRLGRQEEGLAELRRAVELVPGDAEARLDLANALGRSERVEEAIEELSRLLERHPDHRVARTKRATARMDLDRHAEALPDLERLAAEEPEDAAARARLAAALESLDRRDEAREEYLRVLSADGGEEGPRAFAHLALGRGLEELGRHEEALARYRELLAEQPRHRRGHRALAASLIRLGRYREARERLEESLRLLKGDFELSQLLARLLAAAPDADVRDPDRAVDTATRLHELSRRSDYAATLAMAQAAAERFAEAAELQRQAIRLAEEREARDPLTTLRRQLQLYESGRPWRIAPGQDLLPDR
ncbi:MAG: tetratricopeptide repeat protein, partial [Thermoanaerobaculia bacterium]